LAIFVKATTGVLTFNEALSFLQNHVKTWSVSFLTALLFQLSI